MAPIDVLKLRFNIIIALRIGGAYSAGTSYRFRRSHHIKRLCFPGHSQREMEGSTLPTASST